MHAWLSEGCALTGPWQPRQIDLGLLGFASPVYIHHSELLLPVLHHDGHGAVRDVLVDPSAEEKKSMIHI